MTITYENFQNSGIEEKNPEIGKAAPPQSFLWNIFSWTRLLLFSLVLGLLLLVVVSVIGSQNSQLRRDLGTLRATLDNVTSNTKDELQALISRGNSLQEKISSLKVEVDDHRQELLAGRDLSQKVSSLESTVEKKEQQFKTGLSEITERVQELGKDLKFLTCQLASLKNNGSEMACCPLHWVEHEGSCYWFSQSEKSWPDADKYCQLENAHLVVVNSMAEQNFLQGQLSNMVTWMGLTDQNGPWRWVDGTDFEKGFTHWASEQPDNWYGHGLGGGEDCAHFTSEGRWNDDVCQRPFRWVCETKLTKNS
ncbi:C-type lectin domain family 10 member A [Mesocricetus auratus]|uniref:C-type lectin domain family 10 member A n=1 Tax=Mesocricetus auratus TaxID=10036 RepID=A0ABM2XQD9_MESAU|nr:C-type lectin domain family 10 member A [Mesocricetus auratus]XP_040604937.1 C-type lectin domain family 10 member A [Mesocricetus auratus]